MINTLKCIYLRKMLNEAIVCGSDVCAVILKSEQAAIKRDTLA